jgi:hypothetical protein
MVHLDKARGSFIDIPVGVSKHTELTNKEVGGVIDHADSSITSTKLAFGTWEKIAEVVLTSATTSISFTNLDLDKDKCYMIIAQEYTNVANGDPRYMDFNDDTTATNYYQEQLSVDGSTISAGRTNDNRVAWVQLNNASSHIWFVFRRDPLGYTRVFTLDCRNNPNSIRIDLWSMAWTVNANVTKITIRSGATNGLATGSKYILFKVSA